ncbi:uncharacterized protein LOC132275211 [Cornus florida]|uniref:uncharacterized protein LOC132275211 n=1 Tax=Cornus florida TaxID=4283 RepID=UPI00289B0EC3|nr:uncharacterized protein LOC132275211 [Cornus florida]
MGTEVLRPQDCLIQRIRVGPASRKSCYPNGNARFRKPVVRPEQKKRFNGQPETTTSLIPKRSTSTDDDLRKNFNNNYNQGQLVMGQVTILRRGESLDSKIKAGRPLTKNGDDLLVCGTERLGPDPEMVTKQIRIGDLKSALSPIAAGNRTDMYAGSAFSMSPSPRALPLPSFFNKKQVSKIVEDSATRDLRRLLRLD